MDLLRLQAFFSPAKLAIVGNFAANSQEEQARLQLRQNGFQGEILTVSPQDTNNWCDFDALPAKIDCVAIFLELSCIVDVFSAFLKKGVQSVLVFPNEMQLRDRQWLALEERLVELAKEAQVVFPGLGNRGVMSPLLRFSFFGDRNLLPAGNIGFLGYCDSLATTVGEYARQEDWGFSHLLSCNIKSSFEPWQIVEFLHADKKTKAILLHLEEMQEGKYFVWACQDAIREKPIILFKPGTTSRGIRALAAHNGTIPSSEKAWQAAVDQAGIIRTADVEAMADLAQAFSCTTVLPRGERIALIGLSDFYLETAQNMVSFFSLQLSEKILSSSDCLLLDLKRLLGQNQHDAILLLLDCKDELEISLMQEIADIAAQFQKTVVACSLQNGECRKYLRSHGIPCYFQISSALSVLEIMQKYALKKELPYPVQVAYRRDVSKAEQLVQSALQLNVMELSGVEAENLLQAYEIPQPKRQLCRTMSNAVKTAKKFGFPVRLRVISPQLPHSEDWGGVSSFLYNVPEVRLAFQNLTNQMLRLRPEIHVAGCLVSEGVAEAFPVSIRFLRDGRFGSLITLSGWSEFQNTQDEVVSSLASLGIDETGGMVRQLADVLQIRKEKFRAGMKALEDVVLSVARMALDCPQIYQAEIQPVLITTQSVFVENADFILSSKRAWDETEKRGK